MEDENRKYNQEKLISHEVRCYNCQKLSKKHIFTTRLMGPNENLPYGLEVMKYEDIRIGSVTKRKYTVWDKKYVMNKGFFCSSKCGVIYANKHIENLHRRGKTISPNPNGGGSRVVDMNHKLNQLKDKKW